MTLPVPASVRVVDASGSATPGVDVAFTVIAGAGSASAVAARTDADGLASVTWTVGITPGANALQAVVPGLAPVTFSATAIVGPPASVTKSAGDAQVSPPGTAVAIPPAVAWPTGSEIRSPTSTWSS